MKNITFIFLFFLGVTFVSISQFRFEEELQDVFIEEKDYYLYVYNDIDLEVAYKMVVSNTLYIESIIDLYTINSNSFEVGYNTPLVTSSRLVDYKLEEQKLELNFDKKMYTKIQDLTLVSKTFLRNYSIKEVSFKINGDLIYKYY